MHFMNNTIYLICIYGKSALAIRQRWQAYGCGASKSLTINGRFRAAGEGVIISCCNKYDICYETCSRTQTQRDIVFRTCLNSICDSPRSDGFKWGSTFAKLLAKSPATLYASLLTELDRVNFAEYNRHMDVSKLKIVLNHYLLAIAHLSK
ncbi:unnamed protein product [Rotaria socialis]|uniref:Uncharacterized protein n=1 Tax=Rotaria socialis TaxID=392032 RepID=A0A821RMG5_9BILA|nr:unnamed protein product [Rotaria socialis]